MYYVNEKIMRIISKEFGINKTEIDTNTNLTVEYNLCRWEIEYLFAKTKQACKVQINLQIAQQRTKHG